MGMVSRMSSYTSPGLGRESLRETNPISHLIFFPALRVEMEPEKKECLKSTGELPHTTCLSLSFCSLESARSMDHQSKWDKCPDI